MRRLLISFAPLTALLLLVSCNSTTETAEAPAPEPAEVAAPAPAPEPVEETAEATEPEPEQVAEAEQPAEPEVGVVRPAPVAVNTDTQKMVYAVGLDIFNSLEQLDLSAAEIEIVKRALSDAKAGNPVVDFDEWRPRVSELARERSQRVVARQKQLAEEYLDEAAAKPGAQRSPSGMVYLETQAGTGASPKATDTVTVHYRGTLIDGTEFDSSYSRNQPSPLPLNGVIPCWTEGVQKMKVGGKATLTCPSDIAYGDQGRPPRIPGGATLVFDIELIEIGGN